MGGPGPSRRLHHAGRPPAILANGPLVAAPRRPNAASATRAPRRVTRSDQQGVPVPPAGRPAGGTATWLESLAEPDLLAFRERGRALVGILIEYLDETDPGTRGLRLQEAARLAAQHGRQVAELGLSLSQAVAEFLRFRSPFVAELARVAGRRGLDAREATALLTDADAAIDQLLVAMMTGHSLTRGGRGRHRSAIRTEPVAPEPRTAS